MTIAILMCVVFAEVPSVGGVEAWIAKEKTVLEGQRKNLLVAVAAAKRGRIQPKIEKPFILRDASGGRKSFVFRDRKAKAEVVAAFESEIKAVNEAIKSPPLPVLSFTKMKPNQVGRIPTAGTDRRGTRTNYEVLQVLDKQNALIKLSINRLGTPNDPTYFFWLVGSTDGFASGSSLKLSGNFQVIGTQTYKTALGGSNTVFKIGKFESGGKP